MLIPFQTLHLDDNPIGAPGVAALKEGASAPGSKLELLTLHGVTKGLRGEQAEFHRSETSVTIRGFVSRGARGGGGGPSVFLPDHLVQERVLQALRTPPPAAAANANSQSSSPSSRPGPSIIAPTGQQVSGERDLAGSGQPAAAGNTSRRHAFCFSL